MARRNTQFLNFNEPKRASGSSGTTGVEDKATDAQEVAYLKALYLSTIGGQLRNADDARGMATFLEQAGTPTPELQIAILNAQNEAGKLESQQKAVGSSIVQLRDQLDDSLRAVMGSTRGDLNLLLSSQALTYSDMIERIDQMGAEVAANYGSNAQLTKDYFDFKAEIEQKANDLTNLVVQLNDPILRDTFDPETMTLQVTTNPSTGVINDVKFVPRGNVDKGYVETDIRMKVNDAVGAIPVSINAIENGSTPAGTQRRMARLGDMKLFGTFEKSAEDDADIDKGEYGSYVLKADVKRGGLFRKDPEELKSGFLFSEFRTDADDIESGAVVRRGTRLFYSADNGTLQEFGGKDYAEKVQNARSWLQTVGDTNPDKVYYPRNVSDEYLTRPTADNGMRINASIGAPATRDPMAAPTLENTGSSAFEPMQQEGTQDSFFTQNQSVEQPQPQMSVEKPSFFGRKNRQNKPDQAIGGQSRVSEIIDKGKSFFRNVA